MVRLRPAHRRSLFAASSTLLLTLLLSLSGGPALAEPTSCNSARASGMDLMGEQKLVEARAQFEICSAPTCAASIKKDCSKRSAEMKEKIPTLILHARDGDGEELHEISVTMDGDALTEHLDGTPIAVDPGDHTFVFAAPKLIRLEKHVTVAEGDLGRRVEVIMDAASPVGDPRKAPKVAEKHVAPKEPAAASEARGPNRQLLGLQVGGLGVLTLTAGVIAGVLASNAWSEAKSTCGGNIGSCSNALGANGYKNTAVADGAFSTVGIILGAGLIGTGTVLYVTSDKNPKGGEQKEPKVAGLAIAPSFGPGQASLLLKGAF